MVGRGIELLVALASSQLSISASTHTLSFNDRGIGQVEVGAAQTNNRALAHSFYVDAAGNPGRHRNKCDLRAIEGSDNSYAWVLDNQIVATGTSDPNISLPSGLRVGMTKADMARLEPSLKQGPNIVGDDNVPDTRQYYASLANGNRMRVTLVEDEVTEIAIGRKVDAQVTC